MKHHGAVVVCADCSLSFENLSIEDFKKGHRSGPPLEQRSIAIFAKQHFDNQTHIVAASILYNYEWPPSQASEMPEQQELEWVVRGPSTSTITVTQKVKNWSNLIQAPLHDPIFPGFCGSSTRFPNTRGTNRPSPSWTWRSDLNQWGLFHREKNKPNLLRVSNNQGFWKVSNNQGFRKGCFLKVSNYLE